MKSLTGLPGEFFVKISQEAKIQLKDLLELVQQLESGSTAAFLARYRSDLCGGLDEQGILAVQEMLQDCQQLADHRISILAMLEQRKILTPALREKIESTCDHQELQDIYLPFRLRQQNAYDVALKQGLDSLARIIWLQEDGVDITVEAAKHVKADKSITDVAAALHGACVIAEHWLGEKPEILQDLRKLFMSDGRILVHVLKEDKKNPRIKELDGFNSKVSKIPWPKQLMIRRGMRMGLLEITFVAPEGAAIQYLERCLIKNQDTAYAPHLRSIASSTYRNILADKIKQEVLKQLDEQADNQALQATQHSLHKILLAPVAQELNIVGIETEAPGGWRAAVINSDGAIVDCVILKQDGSTKESKNSEPPSEPETKSESGATKSFTVQENVPQAALNVNSKAMQQDANEREETSETETKVSALPADDAEQQTHEENSDNNKITLEAGDDPAKPEETEQAESSNASEQPVADTGKEREQQEASPEVITAKDDTKESSEAEQQDTDEAGPELQANGNDKKEKHPPIRHAELHELLATHDVNLIVFSTRFRQVHPTKFLRSQIRRSGKSNIAWLAVNDRGTWAFASSKYGEKELPQYTVAERCAISRARRVLDPLAEMIKADPKTLGIGNENRELDQRQLRRNLYQTIRGVVNDVGADLNKSSAAFLSLVSGMTERLAKRVVQYRDEHGPFQSREDVMKVQGFSEQIFIQTAGFLRVQGANPLDNTGVHPEYYSLIESIAQSAGCSVDELVDQPQRLDAINAEEFAKPELPIQRVKAAIRELKPERRQLRNSFVPPIPPALRNDDELKPGAKVSGIISSITEYGAFMDIGADKDGLLHISQINRDQIKDSKPTFKVGDSIEVFISAPAQGNKGISLSMRQRRQGEQRSRNGDRKYSDPRNRDKSDRPWKKSGLLERSFGPGPKQLSKRKQKLNKMSKQEKLSMLEDKYRTQVDR